MTVDVTGLPKWQRPNVHLVRLGRKGGRRVVRSIRRRRAKLRGLPAGRYAIAAAPVRFRKSSGAIRRGATAIPNRRRVRVTVRAGRSLKRTVVYGTIRNPGVRKFSPGAVRRVIGPAKAPRALVTRSRTAVKRGTVLTAGPSGKLPYGLLHRVTGVRHTRSSTVLRLRPEQVTSVLPAVTLRKRKLDFSRSGGGASASADDQFTVALDVGAHCSLGAGAALPKPYLRFSDFRYNVDVDSSPWGGGPRAEITADFKQTLGLTVKTSIAAGCEFKVPLVTKVGVAWVGGVPIPVYLQIPIGGRFAFERETTIQRRVAFDQTVGIKAERAGFGLAVKPVMKSGPAVVTGSHTEVPRFSAAAFVGVELGLGIPDLLNVHASAETSLEFTKQPDKCDVVWNPASFSGGGKVGPFSFGTPSVGLDPITLWEGCYSRIVFDGSPGDGPPPSSLGPYAMTPFGPDPQPYGVDVSGVQGPTGLLGFSPALTHMQIGEEWETWSHGYEGGVYANLTGTGMTLSLPPETSAFYLYAEPNPYEVLAITAVAQDGTSSGEVLVDGFHGAHYFGFYSQGTLPIESIQVESSESLAVGEFGIHKGF